MKYLIKNLLNAINKLNIVLFTTKSDLVFSKELSRYYLSSRRLYACVDYQDHTYDDVQPRWQREELCSILKLT